MLGTLAKNRINKTIEWVVILILFIGNLAIARYTFGQVKNYIFIGGLVLVLPLCLKNVWNSSRECNKRGLIGIVLGVFTTLVVISAFPSAKKHIADAQISNLLTFLFGMILYYHIKTQAECDKKGMLLKFIGVFFITGILQSLMGVAQFFFDNDVHGIYKTLATGTLMNPNLYGVYLCISLAAGSFLLYKSRAGRIKYFYIGSLAIMVVALLLCRSRGAILSSLLSGGSIVSYYVYAVYFKNRPVTRRKILAVFTAAAIVLISAFVSLDKSSSQGRLMKALIGYSMVHDNPFTGIGYGKYAETYPKYQTDFLQKKHNNAFIERANEDGTTNNQYLKFLIELGIVGLLVFLFFLLLILRKIFTPNYVKGKNPHNLFIAFSVLCIIFHMFFDETLRFPVMAFIFPLLCAYVPDRENICIGKGFGLAVIRKSLSTIVIVALSLISLLYLRQYPAVKSAAKAKLFLSVGDFSNAVFFAQRAIDSNPNNTTAKIILGRSTIGLGGKGPGSNIADGIAILEPLGYTNPSRDIFLALSVGYFKSHDFERAYEYALKAHKLLPNQIRPKVMLFLLAELTERKEESLVTEEDFMNISSSHPNTAPIASLIEMVGNKRIPIFFDSPKIIQLIDLIMLAH